MEESNKTLLIYGQVYGVGLPTLPWAVSIETHEQRKILGGRKLY